MTVVGVGGSVQETVTALQSTTVVESRGGEEAAASEAPSKAKKLASFRKVGLCSTVFLLLPISLNGGPISLLGYQFHLVGLGLALGLLLAAAGLNLFAGYLIIAAADKVQASSYHQLGELTLG